MQNPAALIWAKLASFANAFFLSVPNLVGALLLLLIAWLIARLSASSVRTTFARRDRVDLGTLLGSLLYGLIMIVAVLIAAAIVFPSVKPVDILGALGIGSVAIGFAFKDILQNLLAGLLVLINRPYRRGDQIIVKDFEGTVEHIQSRATLIKTFDGRRVIIPNSDIYTSPVTVLTAFNERRSSYEVGIGYEADVEATCRIFEETVASVDGVSSDPGPQALPWSLDESSVTIQLRWWSDAHETVAVRARVILAIWATARDNGIDIPYPTRVVLFHDQGEIGEKKKVPALSDRRLIRTREQVV